MNIIWKLDPNPNSEWKKVEKSVHSQNTVFSILHNFYLTKFSWSFELTSADICKQTLCKTLFQLWMDFSKESVNMNSFKSEILILLNGQFVLFHLATSLDPYLLVTKTKLLLVSSSSNGLQWTYRGTMPSNNIMHSQK